MKIYLDAASDLQMAGLPNSRQDVEKFERIYIRAAKQYARKNDMVIDVITDSTTPLDDDFDEPTHTRIWQDIHNMIHDDGGKWFID